MSPIPDAPAMAPAATPVPHFTLARDALGRLVCTLADGTVHVGVVPVRAFPLMAPDEGISLVGPDGRELVWITNLATLDPVRRAGIEQELAGREFSPQIQRILRVSTFSTPSTWTIETDHGPTELVLKGEEEIRRMPGSRTALLIASEHGIVFRVPDLRALDRHSRRLIERFL